MTGFAREGSTHPNDDAPNVGRIRVNHPEALSGEEHVRGFRVPPPFDRQAVKDAVIALLNGQLVTGGTDAATENAANQIASKLADCVRTRRLKREDSVPPISAPIQTFPRLVS